MIKAGIIDIVKNIPFLTAEVQKIIPMSQE